MTTKTTKHNPRETEPHIRLSLQPHELICKHCGQRLQSKGWQKRTIKQINKSTGRIETLTIAYQRAHCVNNNCPLYHKVIRPNALSHFTFRKMQYTIDTMADIFVRRNEEKLTFEAIHSQTGIPTSTAHSIYHRSIILSFCIARHTTHGNYPSIDVFYNEDLVVAVRAPPQKADLSKANNVAVMVDGTSDKASRYELLTILDSGTKECLLSAILRDKSHKSYVKAFSLLQKHYTVLAITADMGSAVKKAIRIAFPDKPFQYCNFHFLRNVGNALLKKSHDKLQRQIRAVVAALNRVVEHVSAKTQDKEILNLLREIRHIANARPRKPDSSKNSFLSGEPFFLRYLTHGERLVDVVKKILQYEVRESAILELLKKLILRIVVPRLTPAIETINELSQKKQLFDELREILAIGACDAREKALMCAQGRKGGEIIVEYLNKYDNNLWWYIKDSRIARTIVAVERFFGKLKRIIRGANVNPGITLDRLGSLLAMVMTQEIPPSEWSNVIAANRTIVDDFYEQYRLWQEERKMRSEQLRYDRILSNDEDWRITMNLLMEKLNVLDTA